MTMMMVMRTMEFGRDLGLKALDPHAEAIHKNIAFDSYYIFPKTLTERSFMIFFICVLKKRLVTFMCGLHLLSLYNSGF